LEHIVYSGKLQGKSEIKINPTILSNVVSTLEEYKQIFFSDIKTNKWQTSYIDQEEIVKRYLNGIPIG